jgi:outer membrane protein assembly factor BamA
MTRYAVAGFAVFAWMALAPAQQVPAQPAPAQQQNKRAAAPRPAASKPAPATTTPTVFPLETLRVEGNHRVTADRVLAASGLKIGTQVDKTAFDVARDRLIASGAFENVGYEYKPSASGTGYDGVLQVIELEPMFPYRFEDLPVSEDAVRATLRKQETVLEDLLPSSPTVLDRYIKTIEEAMSSGSSPAVKVVAQLTADGPGQTVIVFLPSTPRSHIAEIRFKGNQVLPADVLQRTLYETAIGAPYSEATLRKMLDLGIRPLYDARGRIRAAFPQIVTEKAKNVDGVAVMVSVNEGPPYTVGDVRLSGVPAAEISQVERIADWRKGDIANFDDINAGLERVKQRYISRGFLHAAAHTDRTVDDVNHTVSVGAVMELGPQFLFGKLRIDGLDIFSEPAIRKAWKLASGKPFQPDYPDSFLAGVRDEGVFENLGKTRAETHIDEAAHTVDVTLFFSGAGPKPQESRRTQF